MRVPLLLDEDTAASLAAKLRGDGHDVQRVVDVDELGIGVTDTSVLRYAVWTDRIIVTHDDDYVGRPPDTHAGVFYAPNQRLSPHELYRIIRRVIASYPDREAMQPVVFLTEDWL